MLVGMGSNTITSQKLNVKKAMKMMMSKLGIQKFLILPIEARESCEVNRHKPLSSFS